MINRHLSKQRLLKWIFSLGMVLLNGGCEKSVLSPYHPDLKNEMIKLQTPPPPVPVQPQISPRPAPQKRLKKYPEKFYKKVSLALNESISLKEILLSLSQQSGVEIQLSPKIQQTAIFTAYHRPLLQVIEDLCDLANLRFRVIDQALRIEQDTPYSMTYNIQFLNMARESTHQISIATDVFSSAKDSKGTLDNGSNSSIHAKGENNFWQEVKENLETILNGTEPGTFTLNRQGGLISVRATDKQHKTLQDYLEQLRQTTLTQILIEAKVIEVSLKDEFKGGINWQQIAGGTLRYELPLANFAQRNWIMNPTSAQGDILTLSLQHGNFGIILKAIEEYGHSRTLSSPRLTVLNNHTAILKVAQNQVYFRLNYDKQFYLNVNRENVTLSSEIQTIPIGLVMSVHPSINATTGDIIVSLRPTISRLSHSVNDPAVDIAFSAHASNNAAITPKPSLIPIVEVREMDSVLQLKSGKIAVLGGLMETRARSGHAQIPLIGDIPLIGKLFQSGSESEEIVELVILLKATILNPQDYFLNAPDQRLIDEYTHDPRPF
jgi:MSHA type pilus biogenesis protein MshL